MSKPKIDMQAALATAKAPPPAASAAVQRPRAAKSAGRADLVNVSAWLDPQFQQNLMMLKAMGKGKIQDNLARALNLLFVEENMPVVRMEAKQ